MSEFQLQPGQGYIYVGEYFHKFGKSVPTEKKIGKIDSLLKSKKSLQDKILIKYSPNR